jgi:hypothetical protein
VEDGPHPLLRHAHEVRTIVAEGDKVAVDLRLFFRKSLNNRIAQFDLAAFYTLRDGRITHIREIIDTFDLVQQVLERDLAAAIAVTRPDDGITACSGCFMPKQ